MENFSALAPTFRGPHQRSRGHAWGWGVSAPQARSACQL